MFRPLGETHQWFPNTPISDPLRLRAPLRFVHFVIFCRPFRCWGGLHARHPKNSPTFQLLFPSRRPLRTFVLFVSFCESEFRIPPSSARLALRPAFRRLSSGL